MANIFNVANLKKTYYYLKRNGIMPTIGAALERVQAPYFADYHYTLPSNRELELQRQKKWKNPVVFSIVVPVYETKEEFLSVLVDSLLEQTYPYWELILADASSTEKVKKQIEKYEDIRIRYFSLEANAGISENTNRGLEKAKGDYIGLLDHDDYLTPDALYEMAAAIKKGKENNQEYTLTDIYTYFNVGSKIKVKYNGKNAFIDERQNIIPIPTNSIANFSLHHSSVFVILIIITFIWILFFAINQSKLALCPVLIIIPAGIMNIVKYFKTKNGTTIIGTIKGILQEQRPTKNKSNEYNYYYLYEYTLNEKQYIHQSISIINKDKIKNIGNKVELIYNKKHNLIIEKNKRTSLLIQGLLGIFIGLFLLIILIYF